MKPVKEVRAYKWGKPVVLFEAMENPGAAVLEVELDDGRTVQLIVTGEGEVHLRAWDNIAAKLGNMDQTSFRAIIPFEAQTHDPITYDKLPEAN